MMFYRWYWPFQFSSYCLRRPLGRLVALSAGMLEIRDHAARHTALKYGVGVCLRSCMTCFAGMAGLGQRPVKLWWCACVAREHVPLCFPDSSVQLLILMETWVLVFLRRLTTNDDAGSTPLRKWIKSGGSGVLPLVGAGFPDQALLLRLCFLTIWVIGLTMIWDEILLLLS